MDNLNLNSDESILQTTQTLIIKGLRHEAVLTSRRLILVTSETGSIHEDILFADISLARSGVNSLREPILTLNINSPGGEKRTVDLIFIRLTGGQNIAELEKCIAILKEHHVPTEAKSQIAGPAFSGRGERIKPGELAVEDKVDRPAVPELNLFGTSRKHRQPLPDETSPHSPLIIIAAAVLIIVVFVGGVVFVGMMMNAKNVPVNQSVTGSKIPIKVVSSVPTTPAPSPQITSGTGSSVPPIMVPNNGVWVLISYPGNFTGYIGAQGRQIETNGSGNRFYNIPVHDAMIDGWIEKEDGSPEKLEVGIYNGGTLVSKSETTKPLGVVDIHVMVGPAIGNIVVIPPSPEITVSPYTSLPLASIPPSGVWARVFYPRNFTGIIRANGYIKSVNGMGDQFYQLPVTSGLIDGSIEKLDGSADTLIIEVYQRGTLISRSYTTIPLGVVNINAKV